MAYRFHFGHPLMPQWLVYCMSHKRPGFHGFHGFISFVGPIDPAPEALEKVINRRRRTQSAKCRSIIKVWCRQCPGYWPTDKADIGLISPWPDFFLIALDITYKNKFSCIVLNCRKNCFGTLNMNPSVRHQKACIIYDGCGGDKAAVLFGGPNLRSPKSLCLSPTIQRCLAMTGDIANIDSPLSASLWCNGRFWIWRYWRICAKSVV